MTIITISAKARHGKDYTSQIIKEMLEEKGNKVLITHFADLLKYICEKFFNWNGEKNEEGRTLLQIIGTDVIRNKMPDYWVNFLIGIFKIFPNEWDYIIIPDTRFPNENDKLKEYFDTITVRVERPNFNNGLTEEQKNHESETEMDNYIFNYKIINNGDKSIKNEIIQFINYINERVV